VQATHLMRALSGVKGVRVSFQPINLSLRWLRKLHSVRYVRTIWAQLLYWTQLLLRVPRNEVVHIFSAGKRSYTLWTIPALLVSRLFGKKSIVNYHDGRIEEHISGWRSALPTIRTAAVIVSPSDFVVDVLARHGVAARRIYNIADLERFPYRQRRHLRPVFLSNRGLEPTYNVQCILRAFALIQKQFPEASLTVAHDGPCRPRLESLAKELRLQNIRFIGHVPHDRIPELCDSAGIYLTSSNMDCMPVSLLECFASGLPAVATRAGGIPYMVEHGRTGLLVDIGDHEGMAAAAIRLLKDPELVMRLTSNAREEVKKYQWENLRDQWLGLYSHLAGRELHPGS
jgi:glycosyltransferase involved in cell wall biosynthesis